MIMIPLLAGMALYHFALSIRLPAQTINRYRSCSTDLLSILFILGVVVCGGKSCILPSDSISGGATSSASDRIVFDEGLSGNTVLCYSQWQTMHNQHSHTAAAH